MKKFSYLPGFVLVIAAVFRAAWTLRWDPTDTWLLAGGLVVVGVSLVWNRGEIVEWFHDPRGIFAVNTSLSLVLLAGILVLINILTWYRPLSIDLTASGRNSLTPETQKLLADLKTDVSLRQFGRIRDPKVDQLLRAFADRGRRVAIEFVDAERQAREARELGIVRYGTVVVAVGSKYRKVEDVTEQALDTAIIQVTSDTVPLVCFLAGHGERGLTDTSGAGLTRFRDVLKASNYDVRPLSILTEDVPASCGAVVVAGPQREIGDSELDRLTRFLQRGGRVGVLIDPAPSASLSTWLRRFGIKPVDGVIVDESSAGRAVGGGPETALALGYGDHPITRGFGVATMFDGARPLETTEFADIGGKPVVLALTSDQSFVRKSGADATVGSAGRQGALSLAAATAINTRDRRFGAPLNDEGRIVVFGDSDFISNALVARQGNRDLFIRTISWLIGETERHTVNVGERENRRIDLTERAKFWMYVVNLGLIPALPLAGGVAVLIRSKR